MKKDTIDKLIGRIDHIKEEDLQRFFVKLAEQQGFFQQVFEAIQEGLILLDSKGTSASSWAGTAPGTPSSRAGPPFPGTWRFFIRSTNS